MHYSRTIRKWKKEDNGKCQTVQTHIDWFVKISPSSARDSHVEDSVTLFHPPYFSYPMIEVCKPAGERFDTLGGLSHSLNHPFTPSICAYVR